MPSTLDLNVKIPEFAHFLNFGLPRVHVTQELLQPWIPHSLLPSRITLVTEIPRCRTRLAMISPLQNLSSPDFN